MVRRLGRFWTKRVAIGDIIRRAWTTGKNVVDRQGYASEDIPKVLKSRFVSKNEDALASMLSQGQYLGPKLCGDLCPRTGKRRP